jgi:FkbM family methyltransferase
MLKTRHRRWLGRLLADTPNRPTADAESMARVSVRGIGSVEVRLEAIDRDRSLSEVRAFEEAERYADSLAVLNRALHKAPGDTQLLLARASTLYAWGRTREAYEGFLRAEAAGLADAVLDVRLGWTCHQLGKLDEAESRMRRAVAVHPESAESHFGLGAVLQASKRLDEAAASYERALDVVPDHVHCLINLGVCRMDQEDFASAEAWFRRAIKMYPSNTRAWSNLGVALFRQNRPDAFATYEHAMALEADGGDDAETFFNYANGLQNVDRTEEAIAVYEQNVRLRPSTMAMAQYGMTLLADGRLTEGWNYYEFRWFQEPMLSLRANFNKPLWSGQNLHGKTILLRAEQGLGDVFQFIRFAKNVKALGATVLLQNRVGLGELQADFFGVDAIPVPNEPFPEFEYYVNLMSLPRVLGVELDSIPDDVPYLFPDRDQVAHWNGRLKTEGAFNVGLVWAGSPEHLKDQYRSVPLKALLPLLDIPGARFWSLQKGPAVAQLEQCGGPIAIANLDSELGDFRDTAAAVGTMDLVISVDTAVAHLAGALGTPLWVLLPSHAEWRWLQRREDCPWYPTARLFRQQKAGDWTVVVERVKQALHARVDAHRRGEVSNGPLGDERNGGQQPINGPREFSPMSVAPGMTAVAEVRAGILQYLPNHDASNDSTGWYGEWLQPELDFLARLMRLGQTVVEVGAGIGAHTVPMAKGLGPDGHVIAYEADQLLRRLLRQNLQANRLPNVTVMSRSLKGQLRCEWETAALPSSQSEPMLTVQDGSHIETVDALQLDRLDWLKINGGGIAREIVGGAAETLWRLRPCLFMVADDERSLLDLSSFTGAFSYRRWRMETPLFNPNNFNCVARNIFDGRVSIAILAIPEEMDVDIPAGHCVELPL